MNNAARIMEKKLKQIIISHTKCKLPIRQCPFERSKEKVYQIIQNVSVI